MSILSSKNIIVGVTGGVASYKALELCRILIKADANVQVVMTSSAKEFIKPLAFQSITGNKVRSHLFDLDAEQAMGHIELARWADYIIIAPATANIISKIAYGLSDDLLLTLCLATKASILIAPAMNKIMFEKQIIQENISKLYKMGLHIIGPGFGEQACGDVGYGRMVEPEIISNSLEDIMIKENIDFTLKDKKVLITAGPTVEYLDPVRFISNLSSGKMGYYLARAASRLGADVTLISGPVDSKIKEIISSNKINLQQITSADEMYNSVHENLDTQDIFISTAAVVDYKPKAVEKNKIKKDYNETQSSLELELIENKDILLSVDKLTHKKLVKVGFAAETDTNNAFSNAESKLIKKNLDLIFLNIVSDASIGFNSDLNEVNALWKDKEKLNTKKLLKCSKQELSYKIYGFIEGIFLSENNK